MLSCAEYALLCCMDLSMELVKQLHLGESAAKQTMAFFLYTRTEWR